MQSCESRIAQGNLLLHATVLRQQGFSEQWSHDLLLTSVKM